MGIQIGEQLERELTRVRHVSTHFCRRDGLTKKQAEAKLRELVLADNGGERSRNGAAPTVKEMGDALIARMRRDDLKKSHIETASGHLRKHINPCSATCSSRRSSRATPNGWSPG